MSPEPEPALPRRAGHGPRDPAEPLAGLAGVRLADFWAWAYSDLLARDVRTALAQFVVACCLDATRRPRLQWAGPNLAYRRWSLRVHFAGHVDSWDVGGAAAGARDRSKEWGLGKEVVELPDDGAADAYVVCHDPQKDAERVDPLDVDSWELFVLSHFAFHRELGPGGRLDLGKLRFSARPVGLAELRDEVHRVLGIEE